VETNLYECGNVTGWFQEKANSDAVRAVLAECLIECVEVANPEQRGEPFMNRLIGPPPERLKTYRVTYRGKPTTLPAHCMPRDVWFVLRGIALAQDSERT
jgi:hypothetical protein